MCPSAAKCTKKSHSLCIVRTTPLLNLLADDFDVNFSFPVCTDNVMWFALNDLVDFDSAMLPSTDVEEVKRAVEFAFERDMYYGTAGETIFELDGTHWDDGNHGVTPSDPISKLAGELHVEELFAFYADGATGEVDFGALTSLKDIANNCAEKLMASGEEV